MNIFRNILFIRRYTLDYIVIVAGLRFVMTALTFASFQRTATFSGRSLILIRFLSWRLFLLVFHNDFVIDQPRTVITVLTNCVAFGEVVFGPILVGFIYFNLVVLWRGVCSFGRVEHSN